MRRMVWAFAGHTYHIVGNLMLRLKIWNIACHLGHRNGTVLVNLALHIALKPHTKCLFDPTNDFGDVVFKNKFKPWRQWQHLTHFLEPDYLLSHQFWLSLRVDQVPSTKIWLYKMNGWWGRCCLKIYKMSAVAAILDFRTNLIKSDALYCPQCLQPRFASNKSWFMGNSASKIKASI